MNGLKISAVLCTAMGGASAAAMWLPKLADTGDLLWRCALKAPFDSVAGFASIAFLLMALRIIEAIKAGDGRHPLRAAQPRPRGPWGSRPTTEDGVAG